MRSIFNFAVAILVVGCAPTTEQLYWRAGASPSAVSRAKTECQVQALRAAPPSNQTRSTPTYTTPAYTSCYNYGYGNVQCTTTGGQTYGGQVYTYDANADLRIRVERQCMADRGYQLLEFPRCTSEQAAAGLRAVPSRMPDAARIACVTEDGYLPQ